MRSFVLILSLASLSAGQAYAADHGHIYLQIKSPPTGCEFLQLNFKDSNGQKFSPNGNKPFMSEIEKRQRKKKFTDIHQFHVKPGRHTLESIKCNNVDKRITTTINFVALHAAELTQGVTQSNLTFDIAADQNIYVGALDFIPFGRNRVVPLALDRSQDAIEAGQLTADNFEKQFVTLNIDFEKVKPFDEDIQSNATPGRSTPKGKGEIAVHYDSGYSCKKVNIFFKNLDTPKKKNVRVQIKNISSKDGTGFGTQKVPSGRYEFVSAICDLGFRTLSAPALAKSYVDVYPDEIAYAGEILQESSLPSFSSQSTKYSYKFNSKFEAAKNEVENPERLVDRSKTMTDKAQLAVSGVQNYKDRIDAKWATTLKAYEKRLKKYSDDEIPGYPSGAKP